MARTEFEPTLALMGDVKLLWAMDGAPLLTGKSIMPDPYMDIVVNCGGPAYMCTLTGKQVELPRIYLNGLQMQPMNLITENPCRFVAVCVYPWLAAPLVEGRQPLPGTNMIPLDGLWQTIGDTVAKMVEQRGEAEAVGYLHDCLMGITIGIRSGRADLDLLRAAGQRLYQTHGRMRIDELADKYNLSISQLERRYKQLTGLPLKSFARLIRFRGILECLVADPTYRPVDLVAEFGYTDQSHLIHDFKFFAHRTPGELVADWRINGDPMFIP
jgi:AraC-like DNA-binding protein